MRNRLLAACFLVLAQSCGGGAAGPGDAAGAGDGGAADAGFPADSGAGDAASVDAGAPDAGGVPCTNEGEATCSDDALTLSVCSGGVLSTTDCHSEKGMLCEAGACVEPWRFGSPAFSGCEDNPRATPETLVQKAAHYDRLARELHVHPDHNLVTSVRLKAGVSEAAATWRDVERWHTGENDGLWSSSYIASQAFRYGATKDTEALENIRTTAKGMARQFAITGVPGLATREYITPGIEGMECPQDPSAYIPDKEKDDNQWLKIAADGCVNTFDGAGWVTTDHCVGREFAGYCWLDNVSQDEYSGHMLAMGAIGRLVDDPELRGIAADLAAKTARHLLEHDMKFYDWDGRPTEHGKIYALSLSDFPGFSAALALSWMKVASELSGDEEINGFYDNCLLQIKRTPKCIAAEDPESYIEYLDDHVLYRSTEGCTNNYNNFNMIFMAMQNLLWFERRPEVLWPMQAIYEDTMMQAPAGYRRAMVSQGNSFFDFIYAALKRLGPGSTGPAFDEVGDAICTLLEFPASKARQNRDSTGYPFDCTGRLGGPLTFDPIPVGERCMGIFVWTSDPYEMKKCDADPLEITAPVDYLLAYWMGRYFGFISPEM